MNTTQLIKPPPPSSAGHPAERDTRRFAPASEFPPLGERLSEILPLVFVVPVAGPPVVLLLGPLLLIDLLLIPPTALLITLVVVTVVAAGLLAAFICLVASPYLLVRHILKHRGRQPGPAHARRPPRLHERHAIGVSLAPRSDARPFHGPAGPATTHLHSGPSQPVRRVVADNPVDVRAARGAIAPICIRARIRLERVRSRTSARPE